MTSNLTSDLTTNPYNGPLSASGGEGSDTFKIETQDVIFEELGPVEDPADAYHDGVLTAEAFDIWDFEPGVDQITVDADAVTEGGVLASARLDEGTDHKGDPLTEPVLTYENDTQQSIEVVVTLEGTTGVTWQDIEFIGDQVPELAAVT
ncbi:hypothetical protein [uncultured Tateyamaria sp.]|uniref:hypothetical protein n=1 Tax=uncultured Tateyamaria sp. TaxID=455651 RepID=UPI002627D096|nr:hypothetical protein [uncultured Tateyamaria sp.]